MKTIKLRKVGNSYGFTIPKELMEKYQLKEGEELHVIEENDGFTLTPYDPDFEEWTESFKKTNEKYKNTLKALAE
ncbi:AbrB/MazE/SpoVT family DNA-binding domain-containing protein [Natroniella acetigena]|uniref:AbrB/MazE/SpoVT family DNA-binding domain-containing protein n=1 Tax=Natroniella TaxID=52003 RepID=UPI00200A7FB0|nr:AbrB/MazE/SpoVT family DNA-binding domain-containing protein [Natroniella acetigena]MCK8826436.1 AbrB/MazE/SpoVT family DNA-binding domain-containing protein [Natroniella acetigena]